MLQQFRLRYPQGTLSSDLVSIDRGLYIVRSLAIVEGITLATGLAAATTVEEAEDQARSRALALLDFQGVSQVETSTSTPEPVPSRPSPAPVSKDLTEPLPIEPVPAKRLEPSFSAPVTADASYVPFADDDEPSYLEDVASEIETPTFDFSPELPKVPSDDAYEATTGSLFNASPANYSFDSESTVEEMSDANPAIDFSEINAKIAVELKASNWTQDQERKYLEQTYKKRQRHLLTDPELLHFLNFLETFAQSTVEIKRLGWTSEQGRNYLVEHYGVKSRQQLTPDQLLDFLNYLKSQP